MSSLAEQIKAYAQEKHLSATSLARWQTWAEADQAAFFSLVQTLQLGDNHIRDFLDWLEEILLRDGGSVYGILTHVDITRPLASKLSRNDKLKAVKTALRRLRYPQLSRLEEDLRAAVKALDLSSQVRISFPSSLEGDEITFQLTVRSGKELAAILTQLQQRMEDGSLQQLFDMLDQA